MALSGGHPPEHQRIMKSIHYVPPVVALVIAAAWITSLRSSNNALERNNLSLQKKIAESRNSSASQNESSRDKATITSTKSEKPSEAQPKPSTDWVSTSMDWKELVLLNNNESHCGFSHP
jgi:cytoskeletal protein RodZ